MLQKISKLSFNSITLGIYSLIAIFVGFQQYFLGTYNNFKIFRLSVFHFFNHQNPYLEYPNEYYDLFLYNPSFCIFFIPFAFLPTIAGIVFWTLFITLFFFYGLKSLNLKEGRFFIFYLIIPELITSLVNLQTNPILAALIIMTMTSLNNNKSTKTYFYPAINFFIKGYGGIAYVFFLFKKITIKTILYIAISFAIVLALPLIFYSFGEFFTLYDQWFWSLKQDYGVNVGFSVMQLLRTTVYGNVSIPVVQLIGVVCMLATVLNIIINKNYKKVNFLFLSYILIWVIIFNHASESSTYIIASTGVFIWFLKSEKTWTTITLFILFYILTVMSSSDLFPSFLREQYARPYSLKALPCFLVWIYIQIKLFFPNSHIKSISLWKRKLI